jgi:hypothetical protein
MFSIVTATNAQFCGTLLSFAGGGTALPANLNWAECQANLEPRIAYANDIMDELADDPQLVTKADQPAELGQANATPAPSAASSNDAVAEQLAEMRKEMASQRALIEAQSKLIAQQQDQLEKLAQATRNEELQAVRGAGAPTAFLIQSAAKPASPAPPVGTVGEAPPPESEITPAVQSIPEGQGVLTPRGRTVLEPSFEYTRSSKNRLVFRGFELVPGLQVGLIEASDADRDTIVGTIAARHGLTNRLEVEARVPVLARQDRIQVVQQRDQGIVREIKLNEFDMGDIELAARYQINRQKRPDDMIYVANLRLKSRTGKGPFDVGYDEFGVATGLATGSGFWGLQGGASFLLPSDPAVIYGGMSYLWHIPRKVNKTIGGAFIGRVDPGDAISGNLGFGFALNPRFSFSLGYNHALILPSKTEIGTTTQKSKTLQVGSFSLGTSYRINERQSVNFGFEFGMTSDAPDVSLTMRLPFRF